MVRQGWTLFSEGAEKWLIPRKEPWASGSSQTQDLSWPDFGPAGLPLALEGLIWEVTGRGLGGQSAAPSCCPAIKPCDFKMFACEDSVCVCACYFEDPPPKKPCFFLSLLSRDIKHNECMRYLQRLRELLTSSNICVGALLKMWQPVLLF